MDMKTHVSYTVSTHIINDGVIWNFKGQKKKVYWGLLFKVHDSISNFCLMMVNEIQFPWKFFPAFFLSRLFSLYKYFKGLASCLWCKAQFKPVWTYDIKGWGVFFLMKLVFARLENLEIV